MKETVHISKDDEKAIIMSLKAHKDTNLSSQNIYDYVKKYIKIKENTLYKKVQRMAKEEYLLHKEDIHGYYIYFMNPDIEFILEGPTLKLLNDAKEGAAPGQLEHSTKLKEAIQNWMDNLSEPTLDFPLRANSSDEIISACEAHILFQDLENHLSELDLDVGERWRGYKNDLRRLDELKKQLYISLRDEIFKCFVGMDLHFVDNDEYLRDYECNFQPLYLYNNVLHIASPDENGYHEHEMLISWFEFNVHIVEKGDHILWGNSISYLRVPKKDRDLLENGILRFMALLRGIDTPKYLDKAEKIIEKAGQLCPKRDCILEELHQALLYSNFPGICKYLSVIK